MRKKAKVPFLVRRVGDVILVIAIKSNPTNEENLFVFIRKLNRIARSIPNKKIPVYVDLTNLSPLKKRQVHFSYFVKGKNFIDTQSIKLLKEEEIPPYIKQYLNREVYTH